MAVSQVEEKFQQASSTIEEMASASERLVLEADAALDIAATTSESKESKESEHVGSRMLRWLNGLDSLQEGFRSVLGGLVEHQERVGRAMRLEKRLDHCVCTLQILPSLFKIESSCLPVEECRDFLQLVKHIDNIRHSASVSLVEQFRTVESMASRLTHGMDKFQPLVERSCRKVEERKGELERTLALNADQLAKNRDENQALVDKTRQTQQEVGRVVVALQYQDITKQKLDHIELMRSEVTDSLNIEGDVDPDFQFFHEAASLCQAHVDSVIGDLDSACRNISEGVGSIGRNLGGLTENFGVCEILVRQPMRPTGLSSKCYRLAWRSSLYRPNYVLSWWRPSWRHFVKP